MNYLPQEFKIKASLLAVLCLSNAYVYEGNFLDYILFWNKKYLII